MIRKIVLACLVVIADCTVIENEHETWGEKPKLQQIEKEKWTPEENDAHHNHGFEEAALDPSNRPSKCHGIALADATDFGPYQAGALVQLLKQAQIQGQSYQVITGVGLGAINGFILAMYDDSQIDGAIEELRKFWYDLSTIDPFRLWKGGFVYGFFFEKSLYDTTPLNDFIKFFFTNRVIKKHITIGVTNVLTGDFSTFNEHHPNSELIKILQASVSYSGITPPVEAFNQLYFSGNTIYENDVMGAINHCERLGYAEHDIVIDTILGGRHRLPAFDADGKNSFAIMQRSSELWKYYDVLHGVLRAKHGHSKVHFRYEVGPTYHMPSKIIPVRSTPDETKRMLKHGERDAIQVIRALVEDPQAEIERRLSSPETIFYFNKDRQAQHQKKMREALKDMVQNIK